jgi:hypothetical protein
MGLREHLDLAKLGGEQHQSRPSLRNAIVIGAHMVMRHGIPLSLKRRHELSEDRMVSKPRNIFHADNISPCSGDQP